MMTKEMSDYMPTNMEEVLKIVYPDVDALDENGRKKYDRDVAFLEKYFDEEDAESDILLSAIIPQLGAFDREEKIQDIMFSKSITFKAQALENWSQKGKTKTYHIIGVCLEKVL